MQTVLLVLCHLLALVGSVCVALDHVLEVFADHHGPLYFTLAFGGGLAWIVSASSWSTDEVILSVGFRLALGILVLGITINQLTFVRYVRPGK